MYNSLLRERTAEKRTAEKRRRSPASPPSRAPASLSQLQPGVYQREVAWLVDETPQHGRFYMAYRTPGGLMVLEYDVLGPG